MDFELFGKGLLIGFTIAAPIGPIGLLCIQRTLEEGRVAGLAAGLGASVANVIYGMIAGYGLNLLHDTLLGEARWLRLIGGIFLLLIGGRIFFQAPAIHPHQPRGDELWETFGSTLVLTLASPVTILLFASVFAGLGTLTGGHFGILLLVTGIFLGSMLWWLILASGISQLQRRLSDFAMQWINRVSGLLLVGFAVYLLVLALIKH